MAAMSMKRMRMMRKMTTLRCMVAVAETEGFSWAWAWVEKRVLRSPVSRLVQREGAGGGSYSLLCREIRLFINVTG